jgi:hypothetical protein
MPARGRTYEGEGRLAQIGLLGASRVVAGEREDLRGRGKRLIGRMGAGKAWSAQLPARGRTCEGEGKG